uniref:Low density lipoprotein receptor adaptor protein 1a n=1 Tax=Sinocyclocheilus grahami TaxID=75366 RepID=A0A672MWD8_SINGR
MEVLKSARRAFIRSPSLTKQSWSSGKHQKLPENWTDKITLQVIFRERTSRMRCDELGETSLSPSSCLNDSILSCLVVFTQAQAVTLTVAQAFKVAFEFWEVAKKENREKWDSAGETSNSSQSERSVSLNSLKVGAVATENLLDIDDYSSAVENVDNPPEPNNNSTTLWEMNDGLEEAFSRLAKSRTNPRVLDIGVRPQDWNSETDWDKTNGNTPNADELFSL